MNISAKHTLLVGLLLLVPMQRDAQAQSNGHFPKPRIPIGIYAVVRVDDVTNAEFKAAKAEGKGITVAGMDLYLTSDFFPGLLNNPAVSGLVLQVHWDTLNPNPPADANAYFWNYVDDAFSSVNSWNINHPHAKVPKTIQLIVTPGFNSPQWVRDELTPSCDGLFYDPPVLPGSACGKVTFTNFNEGGDSTELPLPWNTTYQSAWNTFLMALAGRYDANTAFVSIAVAGPTAASAEMILPKGTDANQLQFEPQGGPAISPNKMWDQLLSNADLPSKTDHAFIDAWDHAIDTYGEVFSGVTLVATTGNGLPKLSMAGPFTPPSPFGPDCTGVENIDCQAETTILSYFVGPDVGGANGKATQTSGLEVRDGKGNGYLGVIGVRFLSQLTMGLGSASTRILGGAQFNKSVADNPATVGGSPVVEQGLYNVLRLFFTGTPVGSEFGGIIGTAPLNYLQIYYQDIQYATKHASKPVVVVETDPAGAYVPVYETFQDLLNRASAQLMVIAESEP